MSAPAPERRARDVPAVLVVVLAIVAALLGYLVGRLIGRAWLGG